MRINVRSENNPHSASLSAMTYDKAAALKALERFQRDTGLKDRPWEEASGLGEGTLRKFRTGANRSMSTETYEKLAAGASRKLGREFKAGMIRGEIEMGIMVPVRSFVGAGDEVIILAPDEEPIDWVEAPPGMRDSEATLVRGRSMIPAYHDRDILFHRRLEADPLQYRDEILVTQTRGGKRYVKLILPGTAKGKYHLVSVNPSYAPIEDQRLDWIAPIEWYYRRRRG